MHACASMCVVLFSMIIEFLLVTSGAFKAEGRYKISYMSPPTTSYFTPKSVIYVMVLCQFFPKI